jgi:hypothetical protein
MAKQKTKQVGFDRTATEVKAGVWEWEADKVKFRWSDRMGLNLEIELGGKMHPAVFVKDIQRAGMFAEGVLAGAEVAQHLRGGAEETQPDQESEEAE